MIYFAALLLVFALTGAVRADIRKIHPNLAFLYWMLAWTGQSFAVPIAIISVAVAAWGVFADPARIWTIALAAATFALCVLTHLRNRRDGKALLAAVGAVSDAPSPLAGFAPFMAGQKGVKRIPDITYGDAGVRNLLDIYVPETAPKDSMPILVHVHGGGWAVGAKRTQSQPLIQRLASRGWMVADINYRLGPKNRFPAIFSDVLKAVVFVKKNARQYGGDPNFVAITGGSAGGHLACLAALLNHEKAFKPGFENDDASIDAAVPCYGRYDFLDRAGNFGGGGRIILKYMTDTVMPASPEADPKIWELASPTAQAHGKAPPMLVLHGEHDCLLSSAEAKAFAEKLNQVGGSAVFVAIPGAQHAYDMANSALTECHARAVEHFLNNVRARKKTPAKAAAFA